MSEPTADEKARVMSWIAGHGKGVRGGRSAAARINGAKSKGRPRKTIVQAPKAAGAIAPAPSGPHPGISPSGLAGESVALAPAVPRARSRKVRVDPMFARKYGAKSAKP